MRELTDEQRSIIKKFVDIRIREFIMKMNRDAQPNPIAAIVRGLDLLAAQMPQGIRYRIEYDPTRGNSVQLYFALEAHGEKHWVSQVFDTIGSFDVSSDMVVSSTLERIRAHYREVLDNPPAEGVAQSKTD